MNKKIIITKCAGCPNRDHKGAFGKVAYVPICRLAERELPYTESAGKGRGYAKGTDEIPDWCPLADDAPNVKLTGSALLRSPS